MNIGNAIHRWMELRVELAAVERAEHPDIVDRHGRTWTWAGSSDLYRHCGMCWTASMVRDPRNGLPKESVISNPNYDLCDICTGKREA